jgi:hypothetical protein
LVRLVILAAVTAKMSDVRVRVSVSVLLIVRVRLG